MAQPARQLTQREYVRKGRRSDVSTQTTALPKRYITKGEKVLWTMAVVILLIFATMVVAKQASIYESSRSVSNLEDNIADTQKANKDLQAQIQNLQKPDRIIDFAKKNGLKLNTDNVKLVNQ